LLFALILFWTDPQLVHPTILLLMLPLFGALAALAMRMWLRATGQAGVKVQEGELRDRVLALAAQAGVKLRGVYVAPEGPWQNLSAFAMGNRSVMLAGRLLRELTRQEVEAVSAREIAHLHFGHGNKMILMGAAIVAIAFLRFM